MNAHSVFFDPTGRRRRRFALAVAAFALLVMIAAGLFAATIVEVTPGPSLPFTVDRTTPLPSHLAHDAARLARNLYRHGKWLATGQQAGARPQLAAGFYVPWEDSSVATLERHVGDLDWVIPAWLAVTGPDHRLRIDADPKGHAIIAGANPHPKVLPMLQNASNGVWDGQGAARWLGNAPARAQMLDRLEDYVARGGWNGLFFDLESIPPTALPDYLAFLKEAHVRFARHGWVIAVAVPVGDSNWNLQHFAAVTDRIFLMLYDEHWPEGRPGPIASQAWFVDMLGQALKQLPPQKVVAAFGSYAYDWPEGGTADPLTIEDAMLSAHDSEAAPQFDSASGNATFGYVEKNTVHRVWMLDAASASNQLRAARVAGVSAFALWRLGSEDPSVWQIFGRGHRVAADPHVIESIPAGTDVDIQGTGEILRIASLPVGGARRVTLNRQGLILNEVFTHIPLPYSIERSGYRPGLVALTFDDGPDPAWTPKILDILKAKHVPATFFVIGDNALGERGLLLRELAEGHEIGNHSYSHPNLGTTPDWQTELELNATQRLFQAYTGRTLTLFRAPYFGDAEPTTADEIKPAYVARTLGYLNVGLHVDPGDWRRPGAAAIVDRTVAQVLASSPDRSGNVVLLHDSGGDRTQTIAALPALIDQLRAKGYQFVTVSRLIGVSADQAMPRLTPGEHFAARMDFGLFTMVDWISHGLTWLFGLAITLGIGRAIILSALALRQARRSARTQKPPVQDGRFVSVLIPCFNEAAVIETSIRRVLASTRVQLEVIVVDDGSSDGTGDVVEQAFAGDPRVRLLRLANGGKAQALNSALPLASGDYIVALDADTQFEREAIARLVRWFDDPMIGAVAGNAKVGNRVNLVTRWQALEYVTAQNLERRALAQLDAITVVPGAIGAWRRETLREAGGYPADTLAEDQDLTIAIQRLGWKVCYDRSAVAYTEAPESFATLSRQRFRWAYGTVQCIWKHRGIMLSGRPRGLALIGLPQAIVFQLAFAVVSPIIDLALILVIGETILGVAEHGWSAMQADLFVTGTYWLCFMAIDLLAGLVAFALEKEEDWHLLWLLLPQRVGYRQLLYWTVIKAVVQALRGPRVGWGKLERTGRVTAT